MSCSAKRDPNGTSDALGGEDE
jgi:hypothetical protein